jgi:hypothetical protein
MFSGPLPPLFVGSHSAFSCRTRLGLLPNGDQRLGNLYLRRRRYLLTDLKEPFADVGSWEASLAGLLGRHLASLFDRYLGRMRIDLR